LSGLKKVLSYTDDSAQYAYLKTARDLGKYKALLKRENNPKILAAYTKLVNKLTYMLEVHDRNREICLLDSEENTFPSGLLDKALNWLDKEEIFWELEDVRDIPVNLEDLELKKEFPKLRYYQEEALKEAFEAERGIIVSATGTGKSIIFTKLCQKFNVKTLIITPNKEITQNAYDTLVEYFGDDQVMKLNTKSENTGRLNVCNIQTLIKLDPELLEDVHCCIIDEFHHGGATTYQEVNKNHLKNCYYRIGLTATNYRNGSDGIALEAILSNVLYTYTSKDAISEGFLVKPNFKWIRNSMKVKGKYQTQYKEGIVENESRNAKIAELCNNHSKDHVIVLVQQVKHAEILKESIPHAVVITGKEKESDRNDILNSFRKGEINVLIGTSVIGEGVDLPVANVLILAGGGKAKSQVVQIVGRVLRLAPNKSKATIYDFQDTGANYLEDHAHTREEIYLEYFPMI
jgi:superfamily II DNA or RNA helicase